MPDKPENQHRTDDALPSDLASLDQRLTQDGADWAKAVPWTGAMERRLASLFTTDQPQPSPQQEEIDMARDTTRPTHPSSIRRRATRWTIMPLVGIILASVLVVALNGFFQHRAASFKEGGNPIYLTWEDRLGYALGARNGANGHLIWRDDVYGMAGSLSPSGLTLADGTLYLYGAVRGQTQALIPMTAIRASDGHVLWSVALIGELPDPFLAPVVANGIVYATQLQRTGTLPNNIISAFRVSDGHKIWDYAPGLRVSAMQARANTLYLVETAQMGAPLSTQVEAVNATTGQRIWRSALLEGDEVVSATLGGVSMLVTATQNLEPTVGSGGPALTSTGFMHVINLATGRQLWDMSGGKTIRATFDATGATIYAATVNDSLDVNQSRFPPSVIAAYDAQTGARLWQHATDGASSTPVVADTLVYFTSVLSTRTLSSDASSLTALDARTGTQKWQVVNTVPSLANDMVVGSSGDVDPPQVRQGIVYTFLLSATDETLVTAFDALSGHPRWSVDIGRVGTPGIGSESLLVISGTVFVVAGRAQATTAIRASDGKTLWTFSPYGNPASLIAGG